MKKRGLIKKNFVLKKKSIVFTLDAIIALIIMTISIIVFIAASINPVYYSYENVQDKTYSYASILSSTMIAGLSGNLSSIGIYKEYYEPQDPVLKVITYLAYINLKQKADNLTRFLMNRTIDIVDERYNVNLTIFNDENKETIYSYQDSIHPLNESDNAVAFNTIVFGSKDVYGVWGPYIVRIVVWD